MSEPMLLIHGAWLSARSWENYVSWFGERGYDVSAPEWPRKHGDVEELRADTSELRGLGIAEIVDHYQQLIEQLDAPPVLIGHSFGGLFVQLLLDRGLGRAGVALDPAAPKGVLRVAPSSLKAAGPAIRKPSNRHEVVTLTFDQFNYAFTNEFPEDQARAAYERFAVPETGRIFFQAGFENFSLHSPAKLDYEREGRAPLLLIAGAKDNTVPASVVKSNFRKYKHAPSRTDYLEFAGRCHLHMAQEGWQEITSAIEAWLGEVLDTKPAD